MTASKFAMQVIGLTGKSYYEIELEAALGYFANQHNNTQNHAENAKEAWTAANAFMRAMEIAFARHPVTDHSTPSKEE